MFLEISQNLQENTCARVSFFIKKRLLHKCFPVNFAKFLRTPFIIEYLWWLLLVVEELFFKAHTVRNVWNYIVWNTDFARDILQDVYRKSGSCVVYWYQFYENLINSSENRMKWKCKSSHSQTFFEIGVLKSFATFIRKHLC